MLGFLLVGPESSGCGWMEVIECFRHKTFYELCASLCSQIAESLGVNESPGEWSESAEEKEHHTRFWLYSVVE